MGRTDLFAAVKDLAFERKSLYRGSIKERRKLLDFLEMGALSQIMEGGLSGYAYCGEQTGGNGLQQVPGG